MTIQPINTGGFDLTPEPRILPMLGEINLQPWRCIAELIDNSIDGFLHADREGASLKDLQVHVGLPTTFAGVPRISVRDNGPGMSQEILEKAVRAGWTANEPHGNLGMFGMGFNIATARLGTRTHVWTTKEGDSKWYGLTIDFPTLVSQRHFRTPRVTRPKSDPLEHGTEVTIEQLKPDSAQWFARPGNRSRVVRELARVYSCMLRRNGVPLSFALQVNSGQIKGRQHCVWGDGEHSRIVSTPRHGEVDARQVVDVNLGNRLFCSACWQWLPIDGEVCPSCGSLDQVAIRRRRIHGWLGVQRYLSESDFGIDFIRHGRKIEIANKDLFQWDNDGAQEREYPIDDPRYRGRIVGEIHLDHARVTYTKDRFDRDDPAWHEMVHAVRGEGPLRPDRARDLRYEINMSPLSLLFQAFRRSNPQRRVAGGYARLLVAPDNDRAVEMASRFYAGETEYQSDIKWYELADQEDRKLLNDPLDSDPIGGDADDLRGFSDRSEHAQGDHVSSIARGTDQIAAQPPLRTAFSALSRLYLSESTQLRWEVEAFHVFYDDPDLGGRTEPWRLVSNDRGGHLFLVNQQHSIFQSATMTPLDALLAQLAWMAVDFQRGQGSNTTFASMLAELRDRYAVTSKLDSSALSVAAANTIIDIGRSLPRNIYDGDGNILFKELSPSEQDMVRHRMAARTVPNPQSEVNEGKFLEYASPPTVVSFFERHPELFLDGKYWETPYASLDYGSESATEEARSRVVQYYIDLLRDADWLTEQHASNLAEAGRERLLRAALALELLGPDIEVE